jgi:glycosyltransferase involved in cell wall biosynthesis
MLELAGLKVTFLVGTLGRGGAERQLVYMLRALLAANASPRVLCLTRGEALEGEVRRLGVPVEWVGSSGSRPVRLYRVVRALRRARPDLLQSSHFYTNLYVAAAARLVGTREIGAVRNDLFSELSANGLMGRGHLFFPRHLIANSALARRRAVARGVREDRISLVPNVTEAGRANGGGGRGDRRPVRLLFAGRLDEQKRPELFLRVLARVNERLKGPRVEAVMVGDGPLAPRVREMAAGLRLPPGSFEMLGEQSCMGGIYGRADLLMLTSGWEGTPNVVLEAMAHGLPVIATRVGGVPDVVGADRGFLLDPEDEEGLTDAVIRLASDARLRDRLGRRGREYVERHHSPDALGPRLAAVYERALSG